MTQRIAKFRRIALSYLGLVIAGSALFGTATRVCAAETETREFLVRVDGKPSGSAKMTIQKKDDGTTTVSCETNVTVKVLIKKYVYTCQTRETWKAGRLCELSSQCNDDGKQFQLTATAEAQGVRVRVNGREHVTKPEVWLTSYWSLPDPKIRDQVIPVLDADNGRDLQGRLQYIGAAQIAVAGQLQNVQHYRFNGPMRVELYYDATERLVRQEWIEEGHPTALELNRVSR